MFQCAYPHIRAWKCIYNFVHAEKLFSGLAMHATASRPISDGYMVEAITKLALYIDV